MSTLGDCRRHDCDVNLRTSKSAKKTYLHASCLLCGLADTACVDDDPEAVEILREKARPKHALRHIHSEKDEPEQ